MFQRFTREARRAIFWGRLEALHRDENCIDIRDLLLGLTWEEESRAVRIAALKERAVEARAFLGIPHLPSTAFPYFREKEIKLSNDAKKVLAYARVEADLDREYWIDADHILRGIFRIPNPASQFLTQQGITLGSLRSASLQDRREHPPASKPERRGIILSILLLVAIVWLLSLLVRLVRMW
jgi:ATP-dependent Clp protease ATP-binding subunit ClpA